MAATVNDKRASCGREVVGTWTHTIGAALVTVAVAGYVYAGNVSQCDATGSVQESTPWSVSRNTTTGVSTITFHNIAEVTDGRFWFYLSSL